MPVCRLCGRDFSRITHSHLRSEHEITPTKYQTQFPDAEMDDSYMTEKFQEAGIRGGAGQIWSPDRKKAKSLAMQKHYVDPVNRNRQARSASEAYARDPTIKERLSEASIALWRDPGYRESNTEAQILVSSTTSHKEEASRRSKAWWASLSPKEKKEHLLKSFHNPDLIKYGEDNPSWKGGGLSGYGSGWGDIRYFILKRDHWTCQRCGAKEDLQVHHIDHDRDNVDDSNLITLCGRCHGEVGRLEGYELGIPEKEEVVVGEEENAGRLRLKIGR